MTISSEQKQQLAALAFFTAITVVVWVVGAPNHSWWCHDFLHFH